MCACVKAEFGTNSVNRLAIVYRKISEIEPDSGNPRRHPRAQIRQIARSIENFGFNVPFLLDGQRRVIAGHGRLAACRLLGIDEVPTISLAHLNERQRKAFQIAENRLAQNATWDKCALRRELTLLSEVKLDFALEATGFDLSEIQLIVQEPSSENADKTPKEATADFGPPTCKAGDLWLLGRHRLLCADPLMESSYSRLSTAPIELVVTCVTDHLYQSPVDTCPKPAGPVTGCPQCAEFISKLFLQMSSWVNETGLFSVCTDRDHLSTIIRAAEHEGLELADMYTDRDQHEYVSPDLRRLQYLMLGFQRARNGEYALLKRAEINNIMERSTGLRRRRNILPPGRNPKFLAGIADLIANSSAATVFDPLCGGGATLIAAEHIGRTCFALEREPARVDRTIRHWQTSTRKIALHAEAGLSFAEMSEMRNVERR